MKFEIIKNGYLECDKGFVTFGRDMGNKIKIPVYCFLVKHKKVNVLIDTGFSSNFKETWGKRLNFYKPLLENDIPSYLKKINIQIDFIINTHLHIDHCENNPYFKNAEILVQKKEFKAACNPKLYQRYAYPDKIPENLKYRFIDGDFELFNDIKIISTPGHTEGHQSVLLNVNGHNIFIAGDACYSSENLKFNCLPGILWNPDKIMETYEMIRNMKKTQIIFGHEEIYTSL